MLARKIVYARWPISEYVSNRPRAALATATPVPPARPSVNRNWPFWLFVQVGQAWTLISSLSSSPEYSYRPPNFKVWFSLTQVKLSDRSMMGPAECEGYGPPLSPENGDMFTVGMRVGISFPCGNM